MCAIQTIFACSKYALSDCLLANHSATKSDFAVTILTIETIQLNISKKVNASVAKFAPRTRTIIFETILKNTT